jgi:hypothetical protein
LAALAAIAVAVVALEMNRASGQSAGSVATPAKAATVAVAAPPPAGSGTFLVVGVRAYKPPRSGAVEAVVTASAAEGIEQEVGRFSIFPDEPLAASNDGQERQVHRLDATAALAALKSKGGQLQVKVRLVPINPSIASDDASLTVGRVTFQPRQ